MSSAKGRRKLAVSSASMPTLGGEPALEPICIEGDEELSRVFSYTLTLTTPENVSIDAHAAANAAIKQLVGHELSTHVLLDGRPGGGGQQRHISGLVTRARFLRLENRRALYEAVVEPWLALAQRSSDFRIFQNQNVLDIARTVLGAYGFPYVIRTTGSYPQREFIVQYGETDYDFVSRLMHEWGLYYFFEHAEGQHTLVIVDDAASHQPYPVGGYGAIPFSANEASSNEEHCDRFTLTDGLRSGKWITSDFDFTRPKADLTQDSGMPRNTAENSRERFAWPGNYVIESEGAQLARTRMEELGAPGQRASGEGNLRGAVTGCTFTLHDHPQERSNIEYLVISTHLRIQEAGDATGQEEFQCRVDFEARMPRTTGPQGHPLWHFELTSANLADWAVDSTSLSAAISGNSSTIEGRSISNKNLCWLGSTSCSGANNHVGWRLPLPGTTASPDGATWYEQPLYNPSLHDGMLTLNTCIPATSVINPRTCTTGETTGFLLTLKPDTG